MNQQLHYIWKTIIPALENHKCSSLFKKPVDPVALRIPVSFLVVFLLTFSKHFFQEQSC